MLTQHDEDVIEAMIDRASVDSVIIALANVCGKKAEHTRTNWQDDDTAQYWERTATRLYKLI